jgi:heat shock protein HspQ
MNSQPTSNIDELLGLNNQQSETNSSENDLDLIENTASASEDTAEKGWADDVKKRLIFAAIICAVPVTVFMVFYGTALDLKQAFSKKSQEPEAISVEKVETEDPLLAENENLKGTIAIGEQRLALESIDRRQADTEIKLEAAESLELPVVPDTPAPQLISQPAPPTIQRSYDPPTRSISSTRFTAPTLSKAAKSEIKYDTMAIWTQLSQAGSYGNGAINKSNLATKPVVSIKDRLTNPSQKLPPIVASANSTQAELTTNEAKFLEALQNSKAPATRVTPQNSGSKIAMAQQIEARLITAINWIGNEQDRKQRSFIKLSEPLLNNAGEVQVPEGTVLVYEISGVDGGIILGDAVAIIQDEQEIRRSFNCQL